MRQTSIFAWSLAILAMTRAYSPSQEFLGSSLPKPELKEHSRPNVIFILTDDQDVHLSSLDYMPSVKKHLLDQGTYFTKHYCTTALCCPSRVTLWTGKAAHNTNITDVKPPYGGYPKFVTQGFNDNYLPVWLQQAGYNTYYTGKLFNVHSIENYNAPYPAGFTGTDFLLDPYTYNYLNSTFQRNHEPPKSYEGHYSTDVLTEKAFALLDQAVHSLSEKPFFLTIAPVAPHADIQMNGSALSENRSLVFDAPVSAKRHQHLFEGVKVPRTLNFNPKTPSGANWVSKLPRQNDSNIDYNDHFYRQRLRALQAVDEMVDDLFRRLDAYGILDNTYVFYSSDNGYHIGHHRLQPGKSCGYEEDINVPLIVRGPGIAKNQTSDLVSSHTDLAPTFLDILGISQPKDLDGSSIPLTMPDIELAKANRREHVNVEYWGFAAGEGIHDRTTHENNTYKAIRILGPGYNLYYSIWCSNEHELYDMDKDPYQMQNLLSSSFAVTNEPMVAGLPIPKVIARLDCLLLVLKSCKGQSCQRPWQVLHPRGDVLTLQDALASRFDHFYEVEQVKVEYNFCSNGYLVDAEGPMWENEGLLYRDGLSWDEWV